MISEEDWLEYMSSPEYMGLSRDLGEFKQEIAKRYRDVVRRREREASGCAAGYPGDSGISDKDKHCETSPGRWGAPLAVNYTGVGIWKFKKNFATYF